MGDRPINATYGIGQRNPVCLGSFCLNARSSVVLETYRAVERPRDSGRDHPPEALYPVSRVGSLGGDHLEGIVF